MCPRSNADREVVWRARSSTIHFPLTVNYTTAIDSNFSIITDIATKCGFVGSSASDLTVDYNVKLKAKVIVVTIPVSFSSSVSFACPVSQSEIESALGVSSLDSILGSLTRRAVDGAGVVERREEVWRELAARGTTWEQEVAIARVMRKVMVRALETRAPLSVFTIDG